MSDALLHQVAALLSAVAMAGCAAPPPAEPAPVVPVATGARPLVQAQPATKASPEEPAAKAGPITWLDREAVEKERARGRRVMLYFRADWSVTSRVVERSVWGDPEVQRAASRVACVKIDVTETSEANEELAARYEVNTVPTVILLGADGEIARVEGDAVSVNVPWLLRKE